MILSDNDIRYQLETAQLIIDPPLHESQIQPASVDLRLGSEIIVPSKTRFDRTRGIVPEDSTLWFEWYALMPSQFVVCCTLEYLEIPLHLVGILMGKSTLARDGLQIESAGYIDPGWAGKLTLELVNLGPSIITLRAGMLIAQIRFDQMLSAPSRGYSGHYQGDEGARQGAVVVDLMLPTLPEEKSVLGSIVSTPLPG